MIFLTCLFTILASVTLGAPVPRAEQSLSWAPAPSTRGTLSILFSCAATLGLCVWTGVHLNIGPIEKNIKTQKTVSKFLGKTLWALIALLAPDIVLAIALHQLLVAWQYRNAVRTGSVGSREEEPMTLKKAFFAIMGGFSVESNTVEGRLRYSLKIKHIDNVGSMERIHNHPLSEIKDKSKANSFTKFIACIQAGWIILQIVGRQTTGIYITLLELNTAVHVLMAIVMYCVWWHKPADIDEPIIIERLGTFSTTTGQVKYEVQVVLEKAEKILMDGLGGYNQPDDKAIKAARMAAIICHSITVIPSEAARRVQAIQEPIQLYFKRQLKKHVRKCVIDAYYNGGIINAAPQSVVEAAFRAAHEAAHETAHETAFNLIAQKDFDNIVEQLASRKSEQGTTSGGESKQKATSVGESKQEATSGGESKHKATSVGESKQEATSGGEGKQEATSVGESKQEATSGGESKRKVPSDHATDPQVPLNLEESLDKVSMDTRIVTFKAAFRAAYKAAKQQTNLNATSATSPDPTAIQRPPDNPSLQASRTSAVDPPSLKNIEVWEQIFAATRAAQAATRSATRQAIRLAALNAALDETACVSAATNAFEAFIQTASIKDIGHPDDIKRITNTLRRAITTAFLEQHRFGLNLATFESGTIAENVTYTGLYEAARAELKWAQELDTKDLSGIGKVCSEAEQLLAFKKKNQLPRSVLERLGTSLLTVGEVIWDQFIDIPDLFWPRTDKKNHNKTTTRVATPTSNAVTPTAPTPTAPTSVAPYPIAPTPAAPTPAAPTPAAAVLAAAASVALVPAVTAYVPYARDSKIDEAKVDVRVAVTSSEDALPIPTQETPTGSPSQTGPNHAQAKGPGRQRSECGFNESWKTKHRIILVLFAGIAGIFYGSLHLTKWNGRFPTEMERRLWRISCCVGTTTVFPAMVLIWVPFLRPGSHRIVGFVFTILLCTVFLAARAYLIVESFISLRALPRDAFETVSWTLVIPHI